MIPLHFTIETLAISAAAGLMGSLLGLGGGIIVIPMLTLLFGVDMRYAAGAALISVIATSSGAASAYVRDGYSNLRVGMFLEVATTIGAVLGATLAGHVATSALAVTFGVVLLASAGLSLRKRITTAQVASHVSSSVIGVPGKPPSNTRQIGKSVDGADSK